MKLQEALQLYNIPYIVTDTTTGGGFISYKLIPAGSSATPQRLKTMLKGLQNATGKRLSIFWDNTSLFLKEKTAAEVYNYFDYNGYINYQDARLPFIVGFSNGQIILDNMDAARHLLIAGTTGSGKSVFLHDLIVSFICNPHNFLYLVDCKQVEFSIYKNRALIASEVFGEISAARFCNDLVLKMQDRFSDMERAGVNDFMEYKKTHPDARREVLIIDELSDLISDRDARRVIIPQLLRLAQKGRAAGFHVILATQRPDSSVINGTLKGNIPSRVAFRTISNIDSRIILDQSGAELLTGNGDALYMRSSGVDLERVQAPFITLDEIRRLT